MSYIGQTKNSIKRRIYYHIAADSRIGEAIREFEIKNFKSELLWEAVNKKEADIVEKAAICAYKTRIPNGYNVASGGGFSGGAIGNKNAQGNTNMRGKKNPAVVESNKRRKGEKRLKGYKHSEESKKKMGHFGNQFAKGKNLGEKNPSHRIDVKIKKLKHHIERLEK